MRDDEDLAGELRTFLGEERFRRFVGQIRNLAASAGAQLYPWHVEVLDEFDGGRAKRTPRSPAALSELVMGAVPTPPSLTSFGSSRASARCDDITFRAIDARSI